MGKLVLDHPRGELVQGFGDFLEVLVPVTERDLRGAHHVAVQVRNAQAAFGIRVLLLALLQDFRVDDHALEPFQVIVHVGYHISVHDDHAEAHADLRGGKAAPVGAFEGVLEVPDEGGDLLFPGEVGFGGLLAKDFRTVQVDGLYHLFFLVLLRDRLSGTESGFTAKVAPEMRSM